VAFLAWSPVKVQEGASLTAPSMHTWSVERIDSIRTLEGGCRVHAQSLKRFRRRSQELLINF
jgi:hypothetical protein